jgi:tetratricopeptide (TPR) repeat protein
MRIVGRFFRALAPACALSAVLGACQSAGNASGRETLAALGEQMYEARQAAIAADATAQKAARARERERHEEADRLEQEAIDQYRGALAISGDMPEAWNNLGVLLMQQGDLMGSADAFAVAMEQSPTDPRPAENLGLVYARAGWVEDSLRYYDIALERSPNYLPALRGAVKAAHLLGEADERRLDQVKRALLIETDEQWRTVFERERVRIVGRLELDRRARRDGE